MLLALTGGCALSSPSPFNSAATFVGDTTTLITGLFLVTMGEYTRFA